MNEHKVLATIATDEGEMTIFYNGAGKRLTCECNGIEKDLDFIPSDFFDAIDEIMIMHKKDLMCLAWPD